MTIALDNARRLVTQARGRCNRQPGDKRASVRLDHAPDLLRRWADQEGLTVANHV
jgi:hypothetical protein